MLPESRSTGWMPAELFLAARRKSTLLIFSLLLVPTVALGQVTINEIMQNPSVVGDGSGEWFEIYNPGASPVDINGWTIRDDGSDSHVINNGGPLTVPAGGYLVLGVNADSGTNGGVSVDYAYGSGWFLSNSADEIVLLDAAANEIDRVDYDGGPAFPDPNGASMSLANPVLDNNVGANWCESTSAFGDGDLGTPGVANDGCAGVPLPVVINEFVANHTGTDDFEYVEIFGPASTDLSAYTLIEIEGDSAGPGTVDGVFPVGTTNATGHWSTGFLANQLENGSLTFLLVEGWSGSVGTDLDTDNDGVLDVTPWTNVVDSVAVSDGGVDDRNYSTVVLAPNFDGAPFTPGGASRIPDGADTDAVADWLRNDFAGAGIPALDPGSPEAGEALNTPDAPNQAVGGPPPQPTAERLLLTEIVVTPTGGEFIEIFNPGAAAVDLSDVYLTDATFAGGNVFYYNIVTGSDAGGGGFGDFHARFPDGAQIGRASCRERVFRAV